MSRIDGSGDAVEDLFDGALVGTCTACSAEDRGVPVAVGGDDQIAVAVEFGVADGEAWVRGEELAGLGVGLRRAPEQEGAVVVADEQALL